MPLSTLPPTITPRALAWLAASREVGLLHRFEQVVNLVNQNGEVLSLHTAAVGLQPFSWRIDGEFWERLDFDRPVHVERARQTLVWGDVTLGAAAAAVWDPRPDWTLLHRPGWPRPPLAPEAPLCALLQAVIDALARRSEAALTQAVLALAGRGGGLTPAGDDMLVGAMYALWALGWSPDWMGQIAATAAPRTTTLSAAFLHAAAAGEAPRIWHEIAHGAPSALEKLWQIGHSSGRDGWWGFVESVGKL